LQALIKINFKTPKQNRLGVFLFALVEKFNNLSNCLENCDEKYGKSEKYSHFLLKIENICGTICERNSRR